MSDERVSTSGYLEVRVSAPASDADRLARALVDERLAACVQALPGVRSTYVWQGAVESADEVLLLIKTRTDLFDALTARVEELHPYDVPEVVAVPLTHISAAYAGWLADALGGPPLPSCP